MNLLKKEMSFTDLDQAMVNLGYGSEDEWVDWNEVANDKEITYSKNGERHTIVKFDVLYTHGEDETASATYIKITDIVAA